MSAISLITIYCDHWETAPYTRGRIGCGATLPTEEIEPEQARGYAEFHGWACIGLTDLCPTHKPKE